MPWGKRTRTANTLFRFVGLERNAKTRNSAFKAFAFSEAANVNKREFKGILRDNFLANQVLDEFKFISSSNSDFCNIGSLLDRSLFNQRIDKNANVIIPFGSCKGLDLVRSLEKAAKFGICGNNDIFEDFAVLIESDGIEFHMRYFKNSNGKVNLLVCRH